MKLVFMNFRLTRELRELIKLAAEAEGMSQSLWIRWILKRNAELTIKKHHRD